jgi:short-chain 2-methylacyl-CoA dehydrogenase
MDFEFTPEQIGFRDTVRQFADKEVRPIAEELDAKGEFHYALVPKMAELGLFGLIFPEKYGGLGVDTLTYSLVLEELARVDSSVGHGGGTGQPVR